ncbi:MAG: nucleotidyltransferase domain-containing protein [Minisyncoccales bacterium]
MEKEREQIIAELKDFFKKRKDVVFAYLFGSIAYNNYNSKSDIDVAVFLKGKGDHFDKRLELIVDLETEFKRDADVIILNNAKSLFLKYFIVKEGVIIVDKDKDKRTEFEFRAMENYFDYLPISRMYDDAILSKI